MTITSSSLTCRLVTVRAFHRQRRSSPRRILNEFKNSVLKRQRKTDRDSYKLTTISQTIQFLSQSQYRTRITLIAKCATRHTMIIWIISPIARHTTGDRELKPVPSKRSMRFSINSTKRKGGLTNGWRTLLRQCSRQSFQSTT